jgi:membrane associated rhomboid family serine protease
MHWTPFRLMAVGVALMVLGILLPLLMILHILESTLLMNFIAYLASFGGLLIGLLGVVDYARTQRKRENEDEDYFDEK